MMTQRSSTHPFKHDDRLLLVFYSIKQGRGVIGGWVRVAKEGIRIIMGTFVVVRKK